MIDVRSTVVCMALGGIVADSAGNEDALYAIDDALAHSTTINNAVIGPTALSTLGVAGDPASSARRVLQVNNDGTAENCTIRLSPRDGTNDPLDEQPDEFWMELEFEYAYTGAFTGTGDQMILFQLEDANGDQVRVRIRGGAIRVQALNNGGAILPTVQNLITGYTPAAGKRYAYRVHWRGESSNGAGDGQIRFVIVDLDAGSVLADTTVASCGNYKLGAVVLYNGSLGTALTTTDFFLDHLTYSAVSAPGDMDATAGWFESYKVPPPWMGAQKTDPGDSTKIRIAATAQWPEAEIGVRNGATTMTGKFQYKLSSEPTTWTDSPTGAIDASGGFGWIADTIDGLDPSASYDFRVVWDRDSTVSNSEASTLTTLSAAAGSPAQLTLGFDSCISPSKHPVYPAQTLAALGAQEICCNGDWSYTNTDMGYNLGSDYLAFNNARLGHTAAVERALEWHRLFMVQGLHAPHVTARRSAGLWVGLDDHLFRDDLAGERTANKSGDNLTMIQEIRGFVRDTIAGQFFPKDAGTTAGKYWWSRETARTLQLNIECRQKADHAQTNGVSLPADSAGTPWAGEIGTGTNPFNRDNQSTWGTTVMGTEQKNDLVAAVAATDKPLVIINAGCMVANGGMREYQDLGTYPEIWDVLQACEDNAAVGGVIIVSHDLHLAMFIAGADVPGEARMTALGKAASYPKLIGELMVGGGGQGGHRLRWQCGNTVDDDGGLRGGAWDGASDPRPAWASDANSNGAASRWDWDDSAVGYDGTDASGTGNTSKQERATLLEIDESAQTVTYKIVNVETGGIDYQDTASFAPAGGGSVGSADAARRRRVIAMQEVTR